MLRGDGASSTNGSVSPQPRHPTYPWAWGVSMHDWSMKTTSIAKSSSVFLVIERHWRVVLGSVGNLGGGSGCMTDKPSNQIGSLTHGGGRVGVYLYCDGHVAAMRPEDTVSSKAGSSITNPRGSWTRNYEN
jgi:prepilin-type processing-associated H-X9-DG protein